MLFIKIKIFVLKHIKKRNEKRLEFKRVLFLQTYNKFLLVWSHEFRWKVKEMKPFLFFILISLVVRVFRLSWLYSLCTHSPLLTSRKHSVNGMMKNQELILSYLIASNPPLQLLPLFWLRYSDSFYLYSEFHSLRFSLCCCWLLFLLKRLYLFQKNACYQRYHHFLNRCHWISWRDWCGSCSSPRLLVWFSSALDSTLSIVLTPTREFSASGILFFLHFIH